MYLRFGNNPSNMWEIKESSDKKKMTAIYRGRVSNVRDTIEDVAHDERSYRLWKIFNDNNDDYTHMSDVIPLIFYMKQRGYEVVTKIRDSKYVFEVI
jgi:hypothetical protein